MKKTLKFNELVINPVIFDRIYRSSDVEKTKTKNIQNDISDNFNYCAVKQIEKFL